MEVSLLPEAIRHFSGFNLRLDNVGWGIDPRVVKNQNTVDDEGNGQSTSFLNIGVPSVVSILFKTQKTMQFCSRCSKYAAENDFTKSICSF